MRLPAWFARLVARIFPSLAWEAALQCERCGKIIRLDQNMTQEEMEEAAAAHDRFWHQ